MREGWGRSNRGREREGRFHEGGKRVQVRERYSSREVSEARNEGGKRLHEERGTR